MSQHVYAHLEAKHIQVAAYPCEFCPLAMKTNSALLNHVRQTHAEEKQKRIMLDCLQ